MSNYYRRPHVGYIEAVGRELANRGLPEPTNPELLAWHEAWFCCWASVPDLLGEAGPFWLVVEECAVPVPTEIGWDNEACATLMRPTAEKRGLTIGQLGACVLRYLQKCRAASAVDIPL